MVWSLVAGSYGLGRPAAAAAMPLSARRISAVAGMVRPPRLSKRKPDYHLYDSLVQVDPEKEKSCFSAALNVASYDCDGGCSPATTTRVCGWMNTLPSAAIANATCR